jgi:hypothetical protein
MLFKLTSTLENNFVVVVVYSRLLLHMHEQMNGWMKWRAREGS